MLIRGRIFPLDTPVVMGIINVTPDSFVASSRATTAREISLRAEEMLSQGAAILDVGAFSTRPGCAAVSPEEEMQRLDLALGAIADVSTDLIISVDTFRAAVARQAVERYGAAIINDISGGIDPQMFATAAALHVPYVLSHMQGKVLTMKDSCRYRDLIPDMLYFLAERLQKLHLEGADDVIIDPGFGFSKTTEQSFEVLANLEAFKSLGCPVMAGLSRKSMLRDVTGTSTEDALNATTAANMLALQGGASILRVHDVRAAVEAIKVFVAAEKHKKSQGHQPCTIA